MSFTGYRTVWHSGGLWSYITLVWLFPEANIGKEEEIFIQVKAYRPFELNTIYIQNKIIFGVTILTKIER